MEINHVLFLGCCLLVLLVVDCSSGADSEVIATPNTVPDVKNPVTLNDDKNDSNKKTGGSDPVNLDSVEGEKDKVNKLKDGVKSDSSEKLGSDAGHNVQTEKGNSKGVLPVKDGDKKEKSNEGLIPKEKPKESKNEDLPLKKENSPPGEDCDSSYMCTDEVNNLVACLRVPGNESPDHSLLIQNKGKVPLTVRISAPVYVHLEMTKIRLPQKEDKKVKVSIKHGGTDNFIILEAGKGRCSLDFKDVIMHDSGKQTESALKSKYITPLNRTPYVAIVSLAVFLIIASVWMCVRFKQRHFPSSDAKYQKLDMELPVAGAGKHESDENDGWDNSWDDNWDDEEAPKTPSLPVTPSLSSKGLASRRSNKDGWKD